MNLSNKNLKFLFNHYYENIVYQKINSIYTEFT